MSSSVSFPFFFFWAFECFWREYIPILIMSHYSLTFREPVHNYLKIHQKEKEIFMILEIL